ncbi:hypothetical protein NA57DRAFT_64730 [Rhizodiscina lignyota]|uniref:Thioesterase/thiol ester dehydrase-isomerase n=1 Tax=Rhizodiscina lignyota TaxID=1504668 RepID=A0A9P4IIG3_9PEZI|nr:hypothetical protein NA57DRAFT_64730 [Rhizodiscina lignyota]
MAIKGPQPLPPLTERIADHLDVKPSSLPGHYESVSTGNKRGAKDASAYGGWSIGVGVRAAFASLSTAKYPSQNYHLYSAVGNFLGPALGGEKALCAVRSIRDTRTFATRLVEVKQQVRGEVRTVMTILCDFQAEENGVDLVYSAPPRGTYAHWSKIEPVDERRETLLKKGIVTEEEAKFHASALRMIYHYFDNRPCPEGIFGQNLSGLASHVKTTQDHLPMTQKTTADWFRVRDGKAGGLSTPAEHVGAVAFLMDCFLAFSPLVFTHRSFFDAAAVGSIDFAFRLFERNDKIDFSQWHLREVVTVAAAEGRTYSEARLWNEDGKIIANMTQQSILRPLPGSKKEPLSLL